MITGVLTSCGRHDLLQRTLDTFFSTNSWPLERLLVVEDGGEVGAPLRHRYADQPIEWLSTGRRVGQIAAIDYGYSRVTTPFIFHMEDDWEYIRPGFIERSLLVLDGNPKCLQVWIRGLDDTQGHPVEEADYLTRGVRWRRLSFDYNFRGVWHGFSLNPGLRRFADYAAIGGFSANARVPPDAPHGAAESALGLIYRRREYFAAILVDPDDAGYVRHTGRGRTVRFDSSPR